ncbi:MAG TPA: LPS export ABC transporter ATP-binding protein [Gemmatimonas sp.]
MSDPETPSPYAPPADALSLVERAVHGDRSLAIALEGIIDGASDAGATPLHHVVTRFIARHPDEQRLAPDEVRQHLAASVLPRLAGAQVIEPWESGTDPDGQVRLRPAIWEAIAPRRADIAAQLRQTGEHRRPAPAPAAPQPAPAAARRGPIEQGSILSAEGLVKVYRGRKVVNDVALRVAQGEIVGLLGPNGAGKTTTFYMLVGLIEPQLGRIRLDGKDITKMPMYQRARQGIGYLSQEPSIFRKLTVEENILAILETLPLSKEERAKRLESLLDELKIKHLRKSRAYQLSGGERRRLEITRALVTEPKFMMLDEPFAGVDPIAVHDIQSIVADLRTRGIGVLISDHNVEQTLDIVDRAYIMFEGQVKVSGTVRELVFDEAVAKDYLGPTLSARLRARFDESEESVESSEEVLTA